MAVGRYIGSGMIMGWHSFTPNERVIVHPGVTSKALADRIEAREAWEERARPIRRRVTRRPK